ncbi:hypothetical protein QCE62_07120 [Caballeronia sp. LZ033]|uniref:hypothetical protein n=1 Tax=Caballeronia sp. LZ033 TaxID=3038566 RepID=UPI0028587830|nr:hypothetical protein [Caballeronia sp. LZ033]MDR5813363.1 hypothetical protein [Caballeronia sp. LZ033]
MDNFDTDPADDAAYQTIIAGLSETRAIFGTTNAIRKGRGEPPFTHDINAYADWIEAGEPEDPAMAPIIKRLIRDGHTS